MARPAQYSRGRRFVLQATLLVVLLGTLGLAALVGQSRDRDTGVQLTDKPHLTPRLTMRLPKGWQIDQNSDVLPLVVTAKEKLRPDEVEARGLFILQTAMPPGSADDLLRQYVENVPGSAGPPSAFRILDRPGVIVRFDRAEEVSDGQFRYMRLVPGWFAAGIVAGAGPNGSDLGVVLGVHGQRAAGPAGSRLLRQLADGLGLRGRQDGPASDRSG